MGTSFSFTETLKVDRNTRELKLSYRMDEMKGQKGQPTHVACRSSLLFVEGVDQTQFNILPRANPGRLTITYALGVGQFTRAKGIAKSGEFDRL